jgi:ribonuclease HI
MSLKQSFEVLLYKNKLNTKTFIDILPNLSDKTIELIIQDLNLIHNKNEIDQRTLIIWSDGGCQGNGKKNSKAGYSIFFTDDQSSPFYNFNTTKLILSNPTNNKAELSGIEYIFKTICENIQLFQHYRDNIIICTDSMYSINCIDKWYKSWIKNNWKNSRGESVKNKEIITQILEYKNIIEQNSIKTKFKHVFSHTREPNDKMSFEYKLWYGNKKVDERINKILNL